MRKVFSCPALSLPTRTVKHRITRCTAYPNQAANPKLRKSTTAVDNVHIDAAITDPVELKQPAAVTGGTDWSSVLGASALITGSTVGAGMLAMPAATAEAGFLPSMAMLGTCWAVLLLEALLIAEVNLAVRGMRQAEQPGRTGFRSTGQSQDSIITLRQMAQATLGPAGSAVVTCTYLSLAYGLLVAYITKSGETLSHLSLGMLPEEQGMIAATTAVALLLGLGGAAAADNVNRGLTAGLLALFVVSLTSSAPYGSVEALLGPSNWSTAPAAIPIIFLTLVYHDLIPVICLLLKNDRGRIRVALLLGSILPLGMFALWDAVALSVAHGPQAQLLLQQGVVLPSDPLQALLQVSSGPTGAALQGFSLLAVVTSFIGIALGVTETAKTELPLLLNTLPSSPAELSTDSAAASPAPADLDSQHATLQVAKLQLLGMYLLTLSPAAAIALAHPASFYNILQAVGGYGMTILYGILPPLMIVSLQRQRHAVARALMPPQGTNNILPWSTHLHSNAGSGGTSRSVMRRTSGLLVALVAVRRAVRKMQKGTLRTADAHMPPGSVQPVVLADAPALLVPPLLAVLLSFSTAVGGMQLLQDVGGLSANQLATLVQEFGGVQAAISHASPATAEAAALQLQAQLPQPVAAGDS